MAVSRGRLNGIRAVLGLLTIIALVLGIGSLFFPKAQLEGLFGAGVEFTVPLQAQTMIVGALALAWAVAGAIALRDLRNRGLIQAIAIAMGIVSAVQLYMLPVVAKKEVAALPWVITSLTTILFVALVVLYPWRQRAS